uniref:Uncharacterized protein n=1 Tax=Philodina roseola TaxID=96448 RepID=B2L3J6_PHIRO|nr:unknown [Philodina roseola]ACC43960.1 unknown [Philodina roseola]
MFEKCISKRSNVERSILGKHLIIFTIQRRWSFLCGFLILLVFSMWRFSSVKSIKKENHSIDGKFNSLPTLSRVLYLFICENQVEVDHYAKIFPSVSADAIFYCWGQNCNTTKFRPSIQFYVRPWSSEMKEDEPMISFQNRKSFYSVRSRIFIINEKELRLKTKLTWTTARNKMYNFALEEEHKQSWRWAYFTFSDGDIHTACPLADQILTNKTSVNYGNNEENLIAPAFRLFVDATTIENPEQTCFFLFDAFLLTIAPAIGTISGAAGPMAFPGLLAQVVYHIDGMFNAIQHDALPFVLPYCPRYDVRTWWTSQAIFVYRTLCLYGHLLLFDGVHVAQQTHHPYPRVGNPWTIDNDMNLVPDHLIPLQNYMKQSRFVSPIVLHHYSGWSIRLTSETCRRNHTSMKIESCLVHGDDQDQFDIV